MATQSIDVLGLQPNQSYKIRVFATHTNTEGNTEVSNYSPALTISTPSLSGSGTNFSTKNYGTDIQLAGGSLFAGTFPLNTGQIDIVNDTVSGSGVILNQTGLLGVNSGTKEFYLDASTGNAYFAGTIQATIIESTDYDGVTDGSAFSNNGMAINLNNGSITAKQFRITSLGSAYFGGDVTGAAYSGVDLLTWAGGIAQTAANGKNTVGYGPTIGLTGTTSGYGPNGTVYYVSGGTPLFPSTISYSASNQQKGDTFFSYNAVGNIIAQYTATGGSSWSKTLITSQIISELDVGKLTAGTISVAISLTAATIIGGLIKNSGYSGVTDGSAYSTAGMAINLANSTITGQQFRIDTSGNAYFNGDVSGNATISGVLASTVVSNAATGVSAYTIAANALKMSGDSIVNASGQISVINTNGTTFYSGSSSTSGARILVNSLGILGFNSSSTNNFTGRTFALSSTDGSLSLTGSINSGSTITGSTITGSTFQSPNYLGSGSGFAITQSGTSDNIYFSYGTSNVANITVSSNGGISLNSTSQSTSISVGSSPSSVVAVTNSSPSYAGTSGHLRNIWVTSTFVSPPAVNSSASGFQVGDVYLVYAP
jgi:hypothetical protein